MSVDPLVKSILVRCDRRHAFSVFTEQIDLWWPPGHRRFEASTMELELKVGGRFLERSSHGELAVLGEVLAVEEPSSITWSWNLGAPETPTRVTVEFESVADGTRVTVNHSPGSLPEEQWPEKVRLFQRGWTHVLEAYLERVHSTHAGDES